MAGRRAKWEWIDRESVDPDLLAKFDRFRERVAVHLKRSLPSGNGTADTMGSYRKALEDVPLTLKEQDILRYLRPAEDDRLVIVIPEPDELPTPFDAEAAMSAAGIDPDVDVFREVSIGDPEDPCVTIYGTEYVNRVTGQRSFVETGRQQIERPTYEEMKKDPRYKFMGRI